MTVPPTHIEQTPARHGLSSEVDDLVAQELQVLNNVTRDFLANVSHELRTPITAIRGYLAMLEQEDFGALNPEQTDAVRIARRNVERLNRLIGDLLDYSTLSRRQYALPGRPVEMETVVRQALAGMAEFAAERQITLRPRVTAPLGQVLGDPDKLTQAITHLLENAIKFSETETTVTLAAFRRDAAVILEVIDQGIGISPEQLRHVFTPFVQGESGLARRYGGIGMGLALIRHVITLHGGDITLTSVPRQGTTVLVSLPVYGEGGK